MVRLQHRALRRFTAVALAVAAAACSAPGSSPPPGGGGGGTGGPPSTTGDNNNPPATSGPLSLPFSVSDQFVPSGFMGDSPTDFNGIKMSADATKCIARASGAKGSCYSIAWTPAPITGQKSAWVGVYWQYPSNNWGAKAGKQIASGATKVSFSAAGAAGGEVIEFLAGGVNTTSSQPGLTYSDSFSAKTSATLTTAWAHYEIALTGDTYDSVIGAFAWSITTSSTTPVTFYIDDIQWE